MTDLTPDSPAVRLIQSADKIDNRIGPISGADADRLAVLLREAAERLAAVTADRDAAIAERDRMREALEPFAKAADIKLCGEWQDRERFCRTDVGHYLTFGHLRAARAALNPEAKS